mgnify:CR=1 FL=1
MIVSEKLTGFSPPNNTRKFVDLWRPHINEKALSELEKLKNDIHDQETFASKIPDLLSALDISNTLGDPDPSSAKDQDGESELDGSDEENTELSEEFDPDETETIDDDAEDLIDLDDQQFFLLQKACAGHTFARPEGQAGTPRMGCGHENC